MYATTKDLALIPIFALPTELRLQIASHVLEQPANAGLARRRSPQVTASGRTLTFPGPDRGLCLDATYTAASNLSLLLVCRQFHQEFTDLAYQKTRFVLTARPIETISDLAKEKLRNLRKLAIQCSWTAVVSWHKYPFNKEFMRLDELCVVISDSIYGTGMVGLLRRLQNVNKLSFILVDSPDAMVWRHRDEYRKLIGMVMKEDHYQRYDAPGAPNIENTWWDWHYDSSQNAMKFTAREPKPVMAEEEYMIMIKPRIDDIVPRMEDSVLSAGRDAEEGVESPLQA